MNSATKTYLDSQDWGRLASFEVRMKKTVLLREGVSQFSSRNNRRTEPRGPDTSGSPDQSLRPRSGLGPEPGGILSGSSEFPLTKAEPWSVR